VKRGPNEVIIVTGASSGIGAAAATALGRIGVWILLVGRRAAELETVRASVIAAGGEAACCVADLRSAHDRESVIAAALAKTGRIDVLINCAGIGQRGALEIVPMDDIRECFEVNFFAVLEMIQRVVPVMRAQRSGRIINISSMSGRIARPFSAAYDATKHALEAVSDGLREELAPFGVRVIVVQPGYTRTGFTAAADERDPDAGIYEPFVQALRRRDWRRRFAVMPERVAATIVKAMRSISPRPRYAVPRFVSWMLLMRRFCSDRLFYRLLLGPMQRYAGDR
jgi:short-subunit dehydrogenase